MLILREMDESTPPTVLNRMQRVIGLTQRMEALIDSLLGPIWNRPYRALELQLALRLSLLTDAP